LFITAVIIGMMTHTKNITMKILQPVVLAVAMLFSTPIFGLIHAAKHPTPEVSVANETVVFKNNASIAYKS
jgi:hypothetical protein